MTSDRRTHRRRRPWLAAATLAFGVTFGVTLGTVVTGCGDPNKNAGDRCTRSAQCDPPLVCSNGDATDLQGICVWPEALPDAAVAQDATP